MPTEDQLREIHRLAVRGQAAAIAQDVGTRLTGYWLGVSRFQEVRALSLQTLSLGPHAATMVHLARAQRVLGEGPAGLAATLTNMGAVYDSLGQWEEALAYYQQALPLTDAVGDRAGERITRYNMAMMYRRQGQLAEAVEALRRVVALDELMQHPDLASDQAMLRAVEQEWQARGP